MSNCVQLILYLRGQSSKARAGGRGRLDDDTQGAFHELASGLEEIVVFCFQQTVYTITKVRKRCNLVVTTVNRVIFAPSNFRPSLHLQTVSPRLEFAQTVVFKERYKIEILEIVPRLNFAR